MHTVSFGGQILSPTKILCVGRNYVAHIEELGNELPDEMVVFMKPNSAIGQKLQASFAQPKPEALHYEGELAFIVMAGQLAGVGFGLDLTRRELQSRLKSKGLPWERAKAFDGAAVFSEFVALPEPNVRLGLELEVDGQLRQQGDTSMMLYQPAQILQELASFSQLADGDIIMTGTPAGVGPIRQGEIFTGRVIAAGKTLVESSWQAQ
ncbi:fumarylacetoacetate hydrolase family protein [Parahaliea sp. F7430]|uniref:Fumarylacetoacetate hydrolase family protein n=1 Tax=Sediminihaliea albiluteola TaxID=2758564 RepID=A0A7W2TY93_9GAMM|nr:fumarylacetoacetate hydrolase family protein [Sediminihaliea albiluteola]MBA6413999.1 fumarylacetoacetate hydrolase family protein [Sediminihaliea albiluteola]